MKNMQTKTKNQKGFVVLFAVLISAVVLAITLGISNTAYKEILLTSQAREATYSFFAADSGSECALYADLQKNAFSSSGSSFDCGGTTVSPTVSGTRYDFQLQFTNSETNLLSCAVVNVDKDAQVTLPDGTIGSCATVIKSFGYKHRLFFCWQF